MYQHANPRTPLSPLPKNEEFCYSTSFRPGTAGNLNHAEKPLPYARLYTIQYKAVVSFIRLLVHCPGLDRALKSMRNQNINFEILVVSMNWQCWFKSDAKRGAKVWIDFQLNLAYRNLHRKFRKGQLSNVTAYTFERVSLRITHPKATGRGDLYEQLGPNETGAGGPTDRADQAGLVFNRVIACSNYRYYGAEIKASFSLMLLLSEGYQFILLTVLMCLFLLVPVNVQYR